MSCSCHISPPCPYCLDSYECNGCGRFRNENEDGLNEDSGSKFCDDCYEELNEIDPEGRR